MAREKTQGRESVVVTAAQSQSEELDPGLRRDDEVGEGWRERKTTKSKWIPAFAGMTKWEDDEVGG